MATDPRGSGADGRDEWPGGPAAGPGTDFIRAIIARDLEEGKHDGRVVTRFPPEPNGYLHIGHAKSIVLNFGLAEEIEGAVCHLRFDDTNPETENEHFVESIERDVAWLGYDWGEHLYFASDYFERMYAFAEHLIREGKAYVDSQSEEEIRERRGTVTEPGTPSPYRERPAEESLELFARMREGEFPNGAHVVRAKIDMTSPNMLLRDPVIFRIRHARHYRTGDEWCIYPMYDYAHPIEDALECVTHSLCTLEFEVSRPFYDWTVENTPVSCRPRQYEFARLNLDYTVMSKRKLLELVRQGWVDGWDDPRLPTIAGLRRRGVTPDAVRDFCEMIGVAKTESRVDIGKLEYAVRNDLNRRAPRVLCVVRPLRVVLHDYPEGRTETLAAPYYPPDVDRDGTRELPFSRELYIERDDFAADPPEGWRRLAPGRAVRLRHGYVIRCDEVVRDAEGEVVELRCSHDPGSLDGDGELDAPVRGAIHWVSAEHALPCEVRLYDRLFRVPDPEAAAADAGDDFTAFLNPDSLVVADEARIEPSVKADPAGSRYQFERRGYFMSDPEHSAPDALVFNRTVTLRDSWAAQARADEEARTLEAEKRRKAREREARRRRQPTSAEEQERMRRAAEPPRPPELQARRTRYADELGLPAEDADILTRDHATADLFEAALEAGAGAQRLANWIVNELPREIGDRTLENLPFGGRELGELVALLEDGTLSSSAARDVLAGMVETGDSPDTIVDREGLRQINAPDALSPVVDRVVEANPSKAEEYRGGRTGLLGFFMGRVMRETEGRANPELAKRLLRDRLGEHAGAE